jgi:hypothetical protein
MRRNLPIRGVAIGAALLALLLASLLAIRSDLTALPVEKSSEAKTVLSEHAGDTGWHCCIGPACLLCTAPHVWPAAPDTAPALVPVVPEIPVPSLHGAERRWAR